MRVIDEGQLDGEFEGFDETDHTFTFYSSGTQYRQGHYLYHYHYAYMPRARVIDRNGRLFLEVTGVSVSVEVERV